MPNLELDLPGGFRLDFRSILRGSRLGYEVTSQTQAVQYTAAQMQARDWLGHEVTSQTQAVQYTAAQMQARDWLGHEVTSQTQAVQYTAAQMQARDWLGHEVTSQTQAVQYTAVKTFHLLLCPRYESREPDVD